MAYGQRMKLLPRFTSELRLQLLPAASRDSLLALQPLMLMLLCLCLHIPHISASCRTGFYVCVLRLFFLFPP